MNTLKRYIILKSNYVVNVTKWDPIASPGWTPPEGTMAIEDPTQVWDEATQSWEGWGAIGDWYEASEGQLYKPNNFTPHDVPEELK